MTTPILPPGVARRIALAALAMRRVVERRAWLCGCYDDGARRYYCGKTASCVRGGA